MAGIDMTGLLLLIGEQLQPLDVEQLKYILQDNFTEEQLVEFETGEDIAIAFQEENLLENDLERWILKKALQFIGRDDLATKLEIYLAAERHVTTFDDYGYTFICHVGEEDRKVLKQNVVSMPRDTEKEIEMHRGAGELGIKVFKVKHWKTKCKSYFNRYYKTSSLIVVPTDMDIIMKTLSSLCSDSKGRGFVFKNYDILKHLEFLGYTKESLIEILGTAPTSKNTSYIAYIEQKNAIFICEKVSNSSDIHQCLRNVAAMVKYFLTLYNREIQASGVTVIGLLIRENEKQQELVDECSFCYLFSPSYKDFESPATFNDWWKPIENYEGWWHLANPKKQNKLFDDLASEILCFMARQERGLPTLTDVKSHQFKQTYFLYTPRQMDVHFSDAKHIIIHGSYGSGKSILGLKKLELIWKSLKRDEKIIYINFDFKSDLHFLMEKNVKEYLGVSSRKIQRASGICDTLKSPDKKIYVCHNSTGENLSSILQKLSRLNTKTSEIVKTNYHLIIEEYDGETLFYDEATKITKLVKGSDLMESNVILLAQPLIKNRSWNLSKKKYKRQTCMFHELENTFKIIKLEEVLRCSNEICEITKSTQSFVRNKDSVFKIKASKRKFEQQQYSKKHMVLPSLPESIDSKVGISKNENISKASNDSSKAKEILDRGMDLDQAFERSVPRQKSSTAKSKIVSKFGFLCDPRQGVDIKGLKPNVVEFAEDINLTSNIAVISLALVLKNFIGENETTTILHMTDEQPRIVRRSIQLLPRLLDQTFSYTQDIGVYLQKNKQFKIIFCSSFCRVNGMEFDHVIIVVSQSEYYLKYYLPQVISRCTYDLTLVLLPKDEMLTRRGPLEKLHKVFSRIKCDKTKETVLNMIQELKLKRLVKQVLVAECKACEKNCYCDSILNEIDSKQAFEVHTHSDEYKDLMFHLEQNAELEEQAQGSGATTLADAKIQDFLKNWSQQQTELTSISERRKVADFSKGDSEIDPAMVDRFLDVAVRGDVDEVIEMIDGGVPANTRDESGTTALHLASLNNHKDLVLVLVQKGADVNKQTDGGVTPLHWAAWTNSTDVISVLLQQGALVNISDNFGSTALDEARRWNNEEAVHLLKQH